MIFRTRFWWGTFFVPMIVVLIVGGLALMVIWRPNLVPGVLPEMGRGLDAVACIVGFLSLLWLFARLVTWVSSSVTLTDRRLTAEQGLLSRRSTDIPLSKIESVSVNQGLVGQVFGYGTVVITGSGGTHERFQGIAGARALSVAVQSQIAELRR